MSLEIFYNFYAYPVPKNMVFFVTTDVYKNGWVEKIEEHTIIGEADGIYVTRLLETVGCDTEDKKHYGKAFLLPIGLHKSRLAANKKQQLQLFR